VTAARASGPVLVVLAALAACRSPIDAQSERYRMNRQALASLAQRRPELAPTIERGLRTYDGQVAQVRRDGGREIEMAKKMASINDRIEAFWEQLEWPQAAGAAETAAPAEN
jgi:hypothetical protein